MNNLVNKAKSGYTFHLMYKLLALYIALGTCSVVYGQTVTINAGRYQLDNTLKLIVCNQIPSSLPASTTSIQLDRLYTFDEPVNALSTNQFYQVRYKDTTYQLSFTKLPIVAIDTKGKTIVKEVVRASTFSLTDSNGTTKTSYAGINVRGGLSSSFPKKSYKMEFWADSVSQTAKDVTLLDMRTDSDWILLAMYNESLRINNVTAHALWRTMHPLYYAAQEPTALSDIRMRYVDLFVNGSYSGVYVLGETMDRKQLQLKKTKDNGSVRGELYKSFDWTGATLFTSMPAKDGNDTTWAGFELKYPKQAGFWKNLYGLVDSTINRSDARFTSQVANEWQVNNLIDYFLFINLIRATDNVGKNLYVARYKEGEPYIFIAWDLDGTWGFLYDGSRDNRTDDILSNGFYDRLLRLNPSMFKQKMKARWFNLRNTLFATATLKEALAMNAQVLSTNGAYLRESTKWSVGAVSDELAYINTWIDNRTTFLDAYFGHFPDACTNPAAPVISLSSSTITAGQSATATATGCSYTVVWSTGEIGNTIVVSPFETKRYWAVCNQTRADCVSPASTTITLTVLPDTKSSDAKADLRLSLSSSRRIVPVNSTVRMLLALTNDGPDAARIIRLQNRLPSGLSFAGNADGAVTSSDGLVNVNADSLGAYQTAFFSYDVRPTVMGTYRNAAQVLNSATYDPDSTPASGTADGEDDMASIDIRTPDASMVSIESPNPNQRLLPAVLTNQPATDSTRADLSLRIELDKLATRQGNINTIKMTIRNEGGLTATGVAVRCMLPTGMQYVPESGGYLDAGMVSVTGLTIPAGSAKSVVFQAKAIKSGNWTYQAQLMASDQPDPDSIPGNGTTNGEDDEAWADVRVEDQ